MIQDINLVSQKIVMRNGMMVIDSCIKHDRGVD